MTIGRSVRRLRIPRSKSTRNGQFVLLIIIGLYMYYVQLKRKTEKLVRSNTRIDADVDGGIPIHESPLDAIESTHSTTRRNSKQFMTDGPPKKDDRLDWHYNDDRPFNRQRLRPDENAIKPAERKPINSEGKRVMRAKLTQSLDRATGNKPIILVWKAMKYLMEHYKDNFEFLTPPECGSCRITTNRAFVSDCAALVHFNSPDLREFLDLPDPKARKPQQLYVFWSRETPAKTYGFADVLRTPQFDTIFNWTMNYRLDSDVIDYFGNTEYELRVFAKKQNGGWFEKMLSRKNELAMWAVSNCNNTYGAIERMKFAMELINNGLDVTTYGSCFTNKITKGAEWEKVRQRHKFYLSFENSIHCPDYISEKFWRNGLRSGAVPVVWGPSKEDVRSVAPHHSFIHVDDFNSPREIVEYLNYLNTNDTAYREYHKWRFQPIDESVTYEETVPTHKFSLCRLCKKVTSKHLVQKTIPSIYQWLYETRYVDDKCLQS